MHIDGITTELGDIVDAAHHHDTLRLATLLGRRIHDDSTAATFLAEISDLAARPGRDPHNPRVALSASGSPEPVEIAIDLLEAQTFGHPDAAAAIIETIVASGEHLFTYEVIVRLVAITGELSRMGAFHPDPAAIWRHGEDVRS